MVKENLVEDIEEEKEWLQNGYSVYKQYRCIEHENRKFTVEVKYYFPEYDEEEPLSFKGALTNHVSKLLKEVITNFISGEGSSSIAMKFNHETSNVNDESEKKEDVVESNLLVRVKVIEENKNE